MRVVIKFGTGILTRPEVGGLDLAQFRRLVSEVAAVIAHGHECILVSSGAVGAGLLALGLKERPVALPALQACAAIGQSRLMRLYQSLFSRHHLLVAQLLLTHQDIDSRQRHANARNTLDHLLAQQARVIPIINENDSVAIEELRFGDNDRLSAEVAILSQADLLIILSGINGLTRTPDGQGEPIPLVADISEVEQFVGPDKGRLSVGGMVSKLQAVRLAVENGVRTVIANGRAPGLIPAILAGQSVGTTFLPSAQAQN